MGVCQHQLSPGFKLCESYVCIGGIVRHRSRLNTNWEGVVSHCYDFANRRFCILFFFSQRLTVRSPRNKAMFRSLRLEDETISSFPSPGLFNQLYHYQLKFNYKWVVCFSNSNIQFNLVLLIHERSKIQRVELQALFWLLLKHLMSELTRQTVLTECHCHSLYLRPDFARVSLSQDEGDGGQNRHGGAHSRWPPSPPTPPSRDPGVLSGALGLV